MFGGKKYFKTIEPDEIFLDSKNLPLFDLHQFEGRIEKAITPRTFAFFGIFCSLLAVIFVFRLWQLQIRDGNSYSQRAENNSLKHSLIVASRGSVYDRNGENLVWNDPDSNGDFPKREYIEKPGFSHLLGFVAYPAKDSAGYYYKEEYDPKDGIELSLDSMLSGKNGLKLTETDVSGNIVSESVMNLPVEGKKTYLSIDSRIQEKMYQEIKSLADRVGFVGGAGIIMDVNSGEVITMTSYPEYDSKVLSEGEPRETIQEYNTSDKMPFLNRAVSGLFAPGSIVKPFLAFAALEEGVITPEKQIVSTGKLVIPNPYYPDQPSVFLDWKAHGAVDMRHAIAVSSDVYFYEIGGGFESQKGLGIKNIKKYMEMFGFGQKTGINILGEESGNIPDPEWKMKIFNEEWRLGNTYHTAIGQYGTQVTPVEAIRAVSALANGGVLVTPTILKQATTTIPKGKQIEIKDAYHMQVAKEGMKLSVEEGTSIGLNVPYVHIAGKTGTAEIGTATKSRVHSWTMGFFPYEKPKYAYIIVMESGPRTNLVGATSVMRQVTDFMSIYTPEYFETSP